jgi:hypothetical protein
VLEAVASTCAQLYRPFYGGFRALNAVLLSSLQEEFGKKCHWRCRASLTLSGAFHMKGKSSGAFLSRALSLSVKCLAAVLAALFHLQITPQAVEALFAICFGRTG